MKSTKSLAIAGIAALCLAMSACTNPGITPPSPGQGTGSANASQPQPAPPTVGAISTTAPEGGAAAKIGDEEFVIKTVACTVLNGMWSMSGSDDAGMKVAVTGAEDRQSVQTASIVTSDNRVVQVNPGAGSATIAWEGESFTVTGKGQLINLNTPDAAASDTDFVIKATCK